jgi:galactose-1-phosphate uridylyltransferase
MTDKIREIGKLINELSDQELQEIHNITKNVVTERGSEFNVRIKLRPCHTINGETQTARLHFEPVLDFKCDLADATHKIKFNILTKEFISIEPLDALKDEK